MIELINHIGNIVSPGSYQTATEHYHRSLWFCRWKGYF